MLATEPTPSTGLFNNYQSLINFGSFFFFREKSLPNSCKFVIQDQNDRALSGCIYREMGIIGMKRRYKYLLQTSERIHYELAYDRLMG